MCVCARACACVSAHGAWVDTPGLGTQRRWRRVGSERSLPCATCKRPRQERDPMQQSSVPCLLPPVGSRAPLAPSPSIHQPCRQISVQLTQSSATYHRRRLPVGRGASACSEVGRITRQHAAGNRSARCRRVHRVPNARPVVRARRRRRRDLEEPGQRRTSRREHLTCRRLPCPAVPCRALPCRALPLAAASLPAPAVCNDGCIG